VKFISWELVSEGTGVAVAFGVAVAAGEAEGVGVGIGGAVLVSWLLRLSIWD
jgi:hypothetical protein